jgi:hypothetical protein
VPTALAAAGALAWSVASSLWVYPHSLSYFNEAAGGPAKGPAHLVDSNIDWGQDLFYLKEWLDEHPDARPLGLACFGGFDPRVAGIEFTLPPKGPKQGQPEIDNVGPQPGWYAISVNILRGREFSLPNGRGELAPAGQGDYSYFLSFQPVARAGYSIYIYHLTAEDCERVSRSAAPGANRCSRQPSRCAKPDGERADSRSEAVQRNEAKRSLATRKKVLDSAKYACRLMGCL